MRRVTLILVLAALQEPIVAMRLEAVLPVPLGVIPAPVHQRVLLVLRVLSHRIQAPQPVPIVLLASICRSPVRLSVLIVLREVSRIAAVLLPAMTALREDSRPLLVYPSVVRVLQEPIA